MTYLVSILAFLSAAWYSSSWCKPFASNAARLRLARGFNSEYGRFLEGVFGALDGTDDFFGVESINCPSGPTFTISIMNSPVTCGSAFFAVYLTYGMK